MADSMLHIKDIVTSLCGDINKIRLSSLEILKTMVSSLVTELHFCVTLLKNRKQSKRFSRKKHLVSNVDSARAFSQYSPVIRASN